MHPVNTCVVFPHPVVPFMITTGLESIASNIFIADFEIGRFCLSRIL